MRMVTLHPIDESAMFDLAHGLMPPDQKETALAHLRACAECEQRFRAQVGDRELARAAMSPEVRAAIANPPRRRSRAGWIAAVASAAMVAALVIAHFSARGGRMEYWIPIGDETTVLRSGTSPGGVHGALEAYARRDADAAVRELEELELGAGDVTAIALRDLFLASALVNAKRYQESEQALERLSIDTLPTQWRRQARWVRYLALSGLGRDAEARHLLERLADEPGEIGRLAGEARQRRR